MILTFDIEWQWEGSTWNYYAFRQNIVGIEEQSAWNSEGYAPVNSSLVFTAHKQSQSVEERLFVYKLKRGLGWIRGWFHSEWKGSLKCLNCACVSHGDDQLLSSPPSRLGAVSSLRAMEPVWESRQVAPLWDSRLRSERGDLSFQIKQALSPESNRSGFIVWKLEGLDEQIKRKTPV